MGKVMAHIQSLLKDNEMRNLHALDIACGTGIFTRALAASGLCQSVCGLDATKGMLEEAKNAPSTSGAAEINYVLEDAAAMSFASNTFDVVTNRLAVHHFHDPTEQLAEMARVCKPGGLVIIVDIMSNDLIGAPLHNHLEILRDPSHTWCQSTASMCALLENVGLEPVLTDEGDLDVLRFDNALIVQKWLESTGTLPEHQSTILKALNRELDGTGVTTGMYPFWMKTEEGGKQLCFLHKWEVIAARKLLL